MPGQPCCPPQQGANFNGYGMPCGQFYPQQGCFGQQQVPVLSKNVPGVTRTVSSVEWGPQYEERHGACKSYLDTDNAWCPLHQTKFENQFLTINFPQAMNVTQVLTKGKQGGNWVTKVRVIGILNGRETVVGDF